LFRIVGIDIFGSRRWLEATENWTPQERSEWRLKRLGDMLEHCWDHVPFYRELWSDHGVKIRRPGNIDELEAYPIVNRVIFREHQDRIIADNLKSIPHKDDATGGTTGSPLRYKQDLSLHALRYGYAQICLKVAEYTYGDDVCVIAGGSLLPGQASLRNRARNWFERGHGVSCVGMNQHVAKACYEMIQRHQPVLIQGYPSMIAEFCNFLKEGSFSFKNLKAVITTAEMLYPHYRSRIEETLGVPVFDHYGCNDGGLVSFECERHRGFHYNDLESIIEVTSANDSGVGNAVITNLWNRSMPFIRYENGDQIALEPGQCLCGRIYPLIRSVYGRTGDILRFANGRSLGAPGLTLIFKRLPIDGWQVVQTGFSSIEIRIKAKQRLNENDEQYIHQVIHQHLSPEVDIKIRYVNEFATTRHGKLKPVFVEMSPDQPVAPESHLQ